MEKKLSGRPTDGLLHRPILEPHSHFQGYFGPFCTTRSHRADCVALALTRSGSRPKEPGNLDTSIPGYLASLPLSSFLSNPIQSPPGCILHPSHLDLDPRALLSCPALPCALSSPAPSSPGSTSPSVPFSTVPSSALHFFPSRFKKRIHNKTVLFCPALPRPSTSHGPRRDAPPLVSPSLPFPLPLPPPRHRLNPPLTVQTSRYPPLSAHQKREPASRRRQHVALHLVHPPVRRAGHACSSGPLLLGC